MVYSFEGLERTRELIHLPYKNDPKLGGCMSPRRWWGFVSSGIRAEIETIELR
jgi:hypothetical protein